MTQADENLGQIKQGVPPTDRLEKASSTLWSQQERNKPRQSGAGGDFSDDVSLTHPNVDPALRDLLSQRQEVSVEKAETASTSIPIKGRFDKHRSSYWAGAMAILPLRNLIKPFEKDKWGNKDNPASYAREHMYSLISGIGMEAVTGYYAVQTYKDMREIFAEPLACELNKNKDELTFNDFKASKNTIIQKTIKNYVDYTARRALINAAFFTPFIPFISKPFFKKFNLDGETGALFGVAANAYHLFRDVLIRKTTPFESLQTTIDLKVNHADHVGDKITGADLLDVYERNAEGRPNESFDGQRGTPALQRSMQLFERMADLMNQAYKNTTRLETGNFGFPEFIYLAGNGLISPDNLERSLAFVEIANRHGLKEVKAAAAELQNGKPLKAIMQKYAVLLLTDEPETELNQGSTRLFALHVETQKETKVPMSILSREEVRRANPQIIGASLA